MANIIASPTRYIQGKGEMEHLCQHASLIGQKLFVIITESGKKRVEDAITKSAQAQGTSVTYEFFNGECSMNEVNRILAIFEKSGCDAVVGIGGGKIHDTAKAVAYYAHCPVVILSLIHIFRSASQAFLFL